VITLANTAEKMAALKAAAKGGIGSLSPNQRTALDEASHDMTDTGRAAANLLEEKPINQTRRGFFGI
jgi:hypothetical protein